MATYPMHFAKTHLSDLVARAEAGEEVILARDKVSAVDSCRSRARRRRAVGPEFLEPLREEELKAWKGG